MSAWGVLSVRTGPNAWSSRLKGTVGSGPEPEIRRPHFASQMRRRVTCGSADGVAAAVGIRLFATQARETLFELFDRPLDALDLVLHDRMVRDAADRRLDPLVDGALQRLETPLGGREELVEEA